MKNIDKIQKVYHKYRIWAGFGMGGFRMQRTGKHKYGSLPAWFQMPRKAKY